MLHEPELLQTNEHFFVVNEFAVNGDVRRFGDRLGQLQRIPHAEAHAQFVGLEYSHDGPRGLGSLSTRSTANELDD